jgi:hypothetical protein
MGEGTISVDKYISVINYQLDHDRKLQKYFEIKKDMEKVKLVAERIPLLVAELEEAITYAKGQKK